MGDPFTVTPVWAIKQLPKRGDAERVICVAMANIDYLQ
jgi:hypothetical protein